MANPVKAIEWQPYRLELLDQRRLPLETVSCSLTDAAATAQAIQDMVVRGAPAIGITAAYGMVLAAHQATQDETDLGTALDTARQQLAASRPTAVNLFWALDKMMKEAHRMMDASLSNVEITAGLERLACAIHADDIARNRTLGDFGAELLAPDARVLTHCNTGSLATGGHGTALGVIRSASERGKNITVWVDETRPYLQGARLTMYELMAEGIPCKLISDNMSGFVMAQGRVDAVIVGTDRTVANGDVANKIGTYTLAVLCARHKIPFYVACPLSTLDLSIASGADIPIEERSPDELLFVGGTSIAPVGAEGYHPAFDVTPAELVTAIITEAGVARPPYSESLAALRYDDDMNGDAD